MDVTSLLNTGAGANSLIRRDSTPGSAIEPSTVASTTVPTPSPDSKSPFSRRISGVTATTGGAPSRNRTPWDAGGYSLPLTLDTKFSTTPPKAAFYNESPIDHLSESSHSQRSFASGRSRSTSMGSSGSDMVLSTTATPLTTSHPRPAFLGEEPHLEISTARRPSIAGESDEQLTARRPSFLCETDSHEATGAPKSPKHKFSDSHSSLSSYTSSSRSGSHSRISSMSTVSGIQPLGSLLTDVPEAKVEPSDVPVIHDVSMSPRGSLHMANSSPPMPAEPRMRDHERPQSPSDAILITRGSNQLTPEDGISTSNHKTDVNFLQIPRDQSPTKAHKRAISAPDFAAITAPSFPPFAVSESTTFPSHLAMSSPPESPPAPAVDNASTDIICMYIQNCDTGSQPRKAISHIFGRNKLCTRMIPQHIWVHFCRKHYQRSRYRNAHEYSKLQVDLVKKQIDRVQAWSQENERAGKPGIVNSWSLSVRKREAKRLEDRKDSGKKRTFQESEDEDDLDGAVLNGTAVPKWLLEKCGSGYSTEQMQAIVTLLKQEIDSGRLSQIPDIEILPNISSEGGQEVKPKQHVKRRTAVSAHKRSQSMGMALRQEPMPMARRVSQPNNLWKGDDIDTSPAEKRQRLADLDSHYSDRHPMPPLPRPNDRPMPSMPGMRRIHQLAHRPAYTIRENQQEESYFPDRQPSMAPFVFSHGQQVVPQAGPLPAPTPQRRSSHSMASHLEVSSSMHSYNDPRRSMHQRSQSEFGTFNASQQAYRPSSSSGYESQPHGYGSSFQHDGYDHQQGYAPRQDSGFVQDGQKSYYDERPRDNYPSYNTGAFQVAPPPPRLGAPLGAPRHVRHQSTPNAGRLMHRTPPQSYNSTMPVSQQHMDYERRASGHARHSSYANPPMHPPPRTVLEDEPAKAAYDMDR